MKPEFTQQQALEMYDILVEIHSALKDKKTNKEGVNQISMYEAGWLLGIEELLTNFEKPVYYEEIHDQATF